MAEGICHEVLKKVEDFIVSKTIGSTITPEKICGWIHACPSTTSNGKVTPAYQCESAAPQKYKCGKTDKGVFICGANRQCSEWNWCGSGGKYESTKQIEFSNDNFSACKQ